MTKASAPISLRQRLLAGESVIGSWINSGSPIVAELMAASGFDFLCVDAEHSAVDLPQVQPMFAWRGLFFCEALFGRGGGWGDCSAGEK